MKKALGIFLVFLLSAFVLVGCNNDNTPTNAPQNTGGDIAVEGKYSLVVSDEDREMFEAIIELANEMDGTEVDFDIDNMMYMELLSGGKFRMVSTMFNEEEDNIDEGTYTIDGSNITISVDGEDTQGTIEGKKITIDADGESMVFEKK